MTSHYKRHQAPVRFLASPSMSFRQPPPELETPMPGVQAWLAMCDTSDGCRPDARDVRVVFIPGKNTGIFFLCTDWNGGNSNKNPQHMFALQRLGLHYFASGDEQNGLNPAMLDALQV